MLLDNLAHLATSRPMRNSASLKTNRLFMKNNNHGWPLGSTNMHIVLYAFDTCTHIHGHTKRVYLLEERIGLRTKLCFHLNVSKCAASLLCFCTQVWKIFECIFVSRSASYPRCDFLSHINSVYLKSLSLICVVQRWATNACSGTG